MLAFLLAPENTMFSVSAAVVVIIAVLEAAGLMFGASIAGLLDGLFDGPDAEGALVADSDGGGMLSSLLSWLRVGQVPVLVLLIAFLAGFSVIGYAIQGAIFNLTGWLMPSGIAVIPAVVGAFPATRWFGGLLAAILPSDQTSAVSSSSFVGCNAVVTLGTAKAGTPAQARLKDRHGQSHYVMVEPVDPQQSFHAGTEVLLTGQSGAIFHAAPAPLQSPRRTEDPC